MYRFLQLLMYCFSDSILLSSLQPFSRLCSILFSFLVSPEQVHKALPDSDTSLNSSTLIPLYSHLSCSMNSKVLLPSIPLVSRLSRTLSSQSLLYPTLCESTEHVSCATPKKLLMPASELVFLQLKKDFVKSSFHPQTTCSAL